jgi:hypothetical protein
MTEVVRTLGSCPHDASRRGRLLSSTAKDDHLRESLGDHDYDQLADLLTRVISYLPAWTPPADA